MSIDVVIKSIESIKYDRIIIDLEGEDRVYKRYDSNTWFVEFEGVDTLIQQPEMLDSMYQCFLKENNS